MKYSDHVVISRTHLVPSSFGDERIETWCNQCDWRYNGNSNQVKTLKAACRRHAETTGHETVLQYPVESTTTFTPQTERTNN